MHDCTMPDEQCEMLTLSDALEFRMFRKILYTACSYVDIKWKH